MNEKILVDGLASMFGQCEIVDLTVPLAEDLPCAWPTHMPFQRKVYNWYTDDDATPQQPRYGHRGPYYTAFLTLDEHCGTHLDAPCHFIPPPDSGLPHAGPSGDVTLDKVDLSMLMGPAAVIDITELKDSGDAGESPEVSSNYVEQFEREYGKLEQGDIVLFRSDWDDHYQRPPDGDAYAAAGMRARGPGWPAPGVECLEYLYNRGVMVVGLDGVSIGGLPDPAPPHHWGLGHGMLFVELLTNLRKLPPRGAFFIYLPLHIRGGSAGPGRAIALVPKAA